MTSIHQRVTHVLLALVLVTLLAVVAMLATNVRGGPLDPPGAPSSSLPQVEPRIPISSIPFTISQPGSYFLTRNLTAAGAGDGITVNASNVTIDLNGFTIQGVAGSGNAITSNNLTRLNWDVRNGVIDGWASGIYAPQLSNSHLANLIIGGASTFGIFAGGAIIADHITVHGTTSGYGIYLGPVAQLTDCFSDGTAAVGALVVVGDQSTVTRCSTVSGYNGIELGDSSKLDSSNVRFASHIGVDAGNGSAVTHNVVANTGSSGEGIFILDSCLVTDNLVNTVGSGTNGIGVAGTANRIENNQIEHAPVGVAFLVNATGNTAYRNVMRDIPTPITGAPGNEVPGVVGAGSATNPWSNVAY